MGRLLWSDWSEFGEWNGSASPHSYTLTERDDDRWVVAIGDLIKTRSRLSEESDLYPMTHPHLKASEEGIRRAEGVLGFDLDVQHRTILSAVHQAPEAAGLVRAMTPVGTATAHLGTGHDYLDAKTMPQYNIAALIAGRPDLAVYYDGSY